MKSCFLMELTDVKCQSLETEKLMLYLTTSVKTNIRLLLRACQVLIYGVSNILKTNSCPFVLALKFVKKASF